MKILGAVVFGAILAVGLFLLAALAIMWLANIVLAQYDIEQLNYVSALAVTALLGIFGSFVSNSSTSK